MTKKIKSTHDTFIESMNACQTCRRISTIIQEMRSGFKKSFNTDTFFKVVKGLGYNVLLERNGHITSLGLAHLNKK
jgi:hypothetical protein